MRRFFRLDVSLRLLAALLLVFSGLAAALPPAHPAFAAPQSAGLFFVNSTADTNSKDSVLTFREALYIARGGTGASGVNRTLSDAETTQLNGCTFSGSANNWTIDALSCGTSVTDTIFFSGIGTSPIITLASSLPVVNDSAPTVIDGLSTKPTIDAAAVGPTHNGLRISSNNNTVQNIGFQNTPLDNFIIDGNNNKLANVWAWNGQNGIEINNGNNNTIDSSLIGAPSAAAASCGVNKGNSLNGVSISGTSTGNVVKQSTIGCNGSSGIYVLADSNTFGPGNVIGTNSPGTANLANSQAGIYLSGSSSTLISNTVKYGLEGIYISGDSNVVGGNTIRSNTVVGLWISSGQLNQIGGNFPTATGGNNIAANGGDGIALDGATVRTTYVAGNYIGTDAGGTFSNANLANGIHISNGSHGNFIGDLALDENIIAANTHSGVVIDYNAYGNQVAHNRIGLSKVNTHLGNGFDGVLLQLGAHDNTIASNSIYFNARDGVVITGTNTSTNTVSANAIYSNTNGVHLNTFASRNTIGGAQPNVIGNSGVDGIRLTSSANHNLIDYNLVFANSGNGVELIDAGTAANVITQTSAYSNTANGIVLYNASGNTIYNTRVYSNNVSGLVLLDAPTNSATGVQAYGNGASGVQLAGTDALSNTVVNATAHDNAVYGIQILNGPQNNTLQTSTAYNNLQGGIMLGGSGTANNLVTGTIAYLNHGNGILLTTGAHHNGIMYSRPYANTAGGVAMLAANTSYNTLTGTLIYQNGTFGVMFGSGAHHNVIESASIYQNGTDGVLFDGAATNTNFVLRTASNVNGGNGLSLQNGTHDNQIAVATITGNTKHGIALAGSGTMTNSIILSSIYANTLDGINERSGADRNVWLQLSMYNNGGLGIDKNAPLDNTDIPDAPYPVVTSVSLSGGNITVSGTASLAFTTTVKVELYAIALDPSGYGEGKTYLGTTFAGSNGFWSLSYAAPAPACYTAVQTVVAFNGVTSSEFGPSSCRTLIPVIMR